MLYLFRILYPNDENFSIDVFVKGKQTLWDLHNAISKKFKYDNHEATSFLLVSEDDWSIKKEYPAIDYDDMSKESPMKAVTIADVAGRAKQKLLYLFDMFSERYFVLNFISTADEKEEFEYPYFFNEKGQVPDQTFYDFDLDSNENIDAEEDDEDDEFGFNDDDMYGIDENDIF